MNKYNIIKYISRLVNDKEEDSELLEAISAAKLDLETARNNFENVEDFNLIDAAIFSEAAAKKRYDYYIKIAKEQGLKVSNQYILDHCLKLIE